MASKLKKILIIEDSKTINNIISKTLSNLDFETSQAFTLAQAKEFLTSNKYDLIILDLHLPDGEGSNLISSIKSLTKTKVIVLTSTHNNDLREELFEFGILDYIIKDKNLMYSINEIVKIINTLNHVNKNKILIIDDSKIICMQVKTILEPRNYIVHTAYTSKEGMLKLREESYDLLVLDMELPDIHGLKVLELLRKDKRHKSLPVLVLSGTSTPQIIRDVLKNGANDFLKKPFVFEEFILKVDLWIDYFLKTKALEEKTQELQYLNTNLGNLVMQEVEKNSKKDKILFQQSRHAQMGEMIAMIAHQWRQPLSAINSAAVVMEQKIKMKKFNDELAKDISAKIQKYTTHLSDTIDDFRNFFKPNKEQQTTNFQIIYEKVISLIEPTLVKNNIKIDCNIISVKDFETFENELVQVLLNLIKNAEDILMQKDIKDKQISIIIDGLLLSVEDNAGGIPIDIIDKIFDPYFSTKTKKGGTGLGLYMSKTIIEDHCCGELNVQNTKNGALFQIILKDILDV
jgi:DNA-binding response OmpR family regulator/PHD/YefM family antitoxin component YafN of YafNO toxin-antitoxin module